MRGKNPLVELELSALGIVLSPAISQVDKVLPATHKEVAIAAVLANCSFLIFFFYSIPVCFSFLANNTGKDRPKFQKKL
jgi:hypothetical protein